MEQARLLARRTRTVLILLIAQYFFGMGINLIGPPNPLTPTGARVAFSILMLLHVATAIALIVFAIRTITLSRKTTINTNRLEVWGAWSIVGAFVSGFLTVGTTVGQIFAFFMAAAFILAFIFYGRLLYLVRPQAAS